MTMPSGYRVKRVTPNVSTAGGGTALLERPVRDAVIPVARPSRSLRDTPKRESGIPVRRKFQRVPGSRQVLSVRGRRVVAPKADHGTIRFAGLVVVLLVIGVIGMMGLSGLSTDQTFQLQELKEQDSQLTNQLETMKRDVENAKASAEIVRQAADAGYVVSDQPGVLAVQNDGSVREQRAANPGATRPIVDVNGRPTGMANQASSDPAETHAVQNSLGTTTSRAGAQSNPQVPNQLPAVAPYAPNTRNNAQAGGDNR